MNDKRDDERSAAEDFAELDALLDAALDLEPPARDEFVNALAASKAEKLRRLLAHADATDVDAIARDAQRSMAAAKTPPSSANAGRWRLKRELGSGGMGQVWLGVRDADDYVQRAAVKILWSHRADDEFTARFLRERQILASLEHPGLARLLDGGLLGDGRPWFAMEYVDGTDIVSFAKTLSLHDKLELFLSVCAALQFAHERLIIHRDIKPANILVDESGRARLLDFGVATILGALPDMKTRTGGSPLTLQYASPEQVSGAPMTVGSDIYQLGMLLYELTTGTLPYRLDDVSLTDAVKLIAETPAPSPREQSSSVSTDLDAIILQALAKDPAQRYRSVVEFAADIQRMLNGHPVTARPPSRAYVAWRFVQRNALVVGLTTTFVVGLAIATGVSLNLASEASAQAARSAKTQEILGSIFEQADPYGSGAGKNVTLADALLDAIPGIEAEVRGDARLAWEVNSRLGEILSSLGLSDAEKDAFRAALSAAHDLDGNNQRERLVAVAGLGNALVRENPSAALEFFADELDDRPNSVNASDDWLYAQYAAINALMRLRRFDDADREIGRMDEIAEQFGIGDARLRGRFSQLLAGRADRAGDEVAADAHWRDAIRHMRDAENPFALAVMLSNQAMHFGRKGRYDASDAAFQQALAVFDENAPDDPTRASVLRSYAGLLIRRGDASGSIARLNEALAVLSVNDELYTRFVVLVNLGTHALVAGDTDAALDAAVSASELALGSYGGELAYVRRATVPLARTLSFAGDHTNALRLALARANDEDASSSSILTAVLVTLAAGNTELADELLSSVDVAPRALQLKLRIACAAGAAERLPSVVAEATQALPIAGGADAQELGLWLALVLAADADADQAALERAFGAYRSARHPFFDALDRWHALAALTQLANRRGAALPSDIAADFAETADAQRRAAQRILRDDAARLAGLVARFPSATRLPDAAPQPAATCMTQ
ncbi:MAG: serine/threonine-protein kinase [Pseudomonadota bacterium]